MLYLVALVISFLAKALMTQRSSNMLTWHPTNREPLMSTPSKNSEPRSPCLMRIPPYIRVFQGLYNTSPSLYQIYHMRFNKLVFTIMLLARNICSLSSTLCVMFRVPYNFDYIYHCPSLQSLSPILTLVGVDVLSPNSLHLATVFF